MEIGNRVTWTHKYQRGCMGYALTTRTGKIVAINGGKVIVRYRGKNHSGPVSRFRPIGQTTELTDMVMSQPAVAPDKNG